MKKRSRIIMMITAILLILVMISSCLVSSTMAKYVITKKATTQVSFKRFGVTVNLALDGVTASETEENGDSVTLTYTTSLTPGTSKNISASVTGAPSVDAIVTANVEVAYAGTAAFKVANSTDFYGVAANTIYVPIGFKVGGSSSYASHDSQSTTPYSSRDAAATELIIENALATSTGGKLAYADDKMSGEFTKNVEIGLTNLNIALDWPKDYTTVVADSDEIGTYMAEKGSQVVITYTITVTQK